MGLINNLAVAALTAIGLGKNRDEDTTASTGTVATTLREVQAEDTANDPGAPPKWGRAERRRHQRTLKQRDRNTKFGQRSKVFTPKRLHADANNKVLNYINHTLLHKLFGRANLYPKEQA